MATYSVAEAKNRLGALIAAAERGEQVTITRYGKPVVEMKPASQAAPHRVWTKQDHDAFWREVDAIGIRPMPEDSGRFIRKMRDEEDGY